MPTSPAPDAALAALCRTLAARTGIAAVAIFAFADDRDGPRAATAGFAALRTGAAATSDPRALLTGARPARVSPRRLGLAAASCLLQPILGPPSDDGRRAAIGAIAVAPLAPHRGEARLPEALGDGAEIAAPLIAAAGPAPAHLAAAAPVAAAAAWVPAASAVAEAPQRPAADGHEALRGAILPRMAAHQLIAALLRARRKTSALAFLLVDIDRFRAVNEALGAGTGDAVLAVIGSRLEVCLGPGDRLIRLEGDRFLVVAVTSGGRDIRELAAALIAAVAERFDLAGRRIAMRASIGAVLAARAETSPVRLLMQADAALRQAKADGGNRLEIHEPGLHAALLERSRLELDLRDALENRELGLVYQPYVDLATGEASGVEALLRWRHPSRGEIAPATFIPLAEATGLILPIGMWALRTACRAAAAWPGQLTVAVNISALQFHAPGFVAEVDAALADAGFPADRLELEITETVLMRDNPDTNAQLRTLIGRGIRIALDDFGTGYSALAYLSRLPHHRIKLDKSFVHDLARPATAALIRAIIALARAGGIATTAEGVERPDQLRAVSALGFTHAQGYATGAPMTDPGQLCRAASPA